MKNISQRSVNHLKYVEHIIFDEISLLCGQMTSRGTNNIRENESSIISFFFAFFPTCVLPSRIEKLVHRLHKLLHIPL